MSNIFEDLAERYDSWYDKNFWVYLSELELLKRFFRKGDLFLEVGVGTGRFASPLGIQVGVDISERMLFYARQRVKSVFKADAKALPFQDMVFDGVLFNMTLCFVDNPQLALREAYRVLRNSGFIVVSFVRKDSQLGYFYQTKKSPFYKSARFFSLFDMISLLEVTGFSCAEICSLSIPNLLHINSALYIYPHGQGDVVGIKALKR